MHFINSVGAMAPLAPPVPTPMPLGTVFTNPVTYASLRIKMILLLLDQVYCTQ